MATTKAERNQTVDSLETAFKDASGIYLTDFTAIDVEKISRFRRNLRQSGGKYIVVKNTLARIALKRCGKEKLLPFIKGPVGVAYSSSDSIEPARIIRDFKKENKDLMQVRVALVDNTIFDGAQAILLADLPSREVLLSQLLSCLKAPMSGLVGALSGVITKLPQTLEAVKVKKEQAAG